MAVPGLPNGNNGRPNGNGGLKVAAWISTFLVGLISVLMAGVYRQVESISSEQKSLSKELAEVRESYVPRGEIDRKFERLTDSIQVLADSNHELSLNVTKFVTKMKAREEIELDRLRNRNNAPNPR